MSTADLGTFACDACGKNYKWKPEFTGRKIKCKCGHVMAPLEPLRPRTAPAPSSGFDLDGLYDLQPDAATLSRAESQDPATGAGTGAGTAMQCPSCGVALQPAQALCLDCGYNLKTGSKLKTQLVSNHVPTPSRAAVRQMEYEAKPTDLEARLGLSLKRDIYLPVALIVAGTILAFVNATWGLRLNFLAASIWVGFWTILGSIITFIGLLVTAKLLSLGLGHPLQVLLKVAAVALLPTAVSDIVQNASNDAAIGFIGWGVSLVITYILFMVLFGMDFGESIFCATVIWVLTNWVLGFILIALVAGVGVGLASGGGAVYDGDEDEDDALVEPKAPKKPAKKKVPAAVSPDDDAADPQIPDPEAMEPEPGIDPDEDDTDEGAEDDEDACRAHPALPAFLRMHPEIFA